MDRPPLTLKARNLCKLLDWLSRCQFEKVSASLQGSPRCFLRDRFTSQLFPAFLPGGSRCTVASSDSVTTVGVALCTPEAFLSAGDGAYCPLASSSGLGIWIILRLEGVGYACLLWICIRFTNGILILIRIVLRLHVTAWFVFLRPFPSRRLIGRAGSAVARCCFSHSEILRCTSTTSAAADRSGTIATA